MTTILLALLIASPLLWLLSLLWLSSWQHIRPFFALNLVVLLAYLLVLTSPGVSPFEVDPYGLGRTFLIIAAVLSHVLLGFIFALGYYFKSRRAQ
ncbi:hypothetical protein [Hymenobacter cellulosivorans]|uniref:Uncharacterized protein n=1 Tax=Hymenobacter cellulosivorans TaxID=2932249 RepID=A0ABY4FGZ5_9BACT|nr:hypothetical protein [Hymenobacter cellulosivorans]UOQ55244.1 hypothetical protein MUN80_10910 [Hymenobacter cellulosivorans]